MPELPEVETTCQGIKGHIVGQSVIEVKIRQAMLRWPIPEKLSGKLKDQRVLSVKRRGKYILIGFKNGTIILHLGMSGSLRIASLNLAPEKHDHVDICFENGVCLRFRDPRRFGCILWTEDDPLKHKLLEKLGVEPLSEQFSGDYLYDLSRNKKLAIKSFIMDGHRVVGVGNIYANEALFRAKLNPKRTAASIDRSDYEKLASSVREVLSEAILQGGTTLKDFVNESGNPGYFKQSLAVYGRAGFPCPCCKTNIVLFRQGLRASYYCPNCQV